MDDVPKRQGLQKHPGSGVYRLRRAIPHDLRAHYEGRREILESHHTKNSRDALLKHDRRWADLTEEFHRLRTPQVVAEAPRPRVAPGEAAAWIEAAVLSELRLWLVEDERMLRELRPTASELDDALEGVAAEADSYFAPDQANAVLRSAANNIMDALGMRLPPASDSYRLLIGRLNDACLERWERYHQQLHPEGIRRYPNRPTGYETVEGGGSRNHGITPNLESPQSRVGSSQISVLALTDRFWLDVNNARYAPKTRATAWLTGSKALFEVCGRDTPIDQITRAHIVEVRNLLVRTPVFASQQFKGKTLSEAARLAEEQGVDTISRKTADNQLKWIKKIFAYAAGDAGLLEVNPAKEVYLKVEADRPRRVPWLVGEIQTLLDSPIFIGCKDGELGCHVAGTHQHRGGRFWVPLIALFQGLRMNEAAQLYTDDIAEIDGVPIIEVRADKSRGQTVKRVASQRRVPMHPTLIELGLAEFALSNADPTPQPLFPELALDRFKKRTDPFSKWFSRLREKRGLTRPGLTFHSFRHSFADAMRESDISPERQDVLGGWETPGSQRRDYGSGHSLASLTPEIAKIRYPGLDLTRIRRWRELQAGG